MLRYERMANQQQAFLDSLWMKAEKPDLECPNEQPLTAFQASLIDAIQSNEVLSHTQSKMQSIEI